MSNPEIRLTCICCGASSFRPFREVNGYHMVRCSQCGFVQVYPLPDFSAIETHYNDTRTSEEKKQLRKKLLAEFMDSSNNPKRDYFESVLTQVKQKAGKEKLDILEIGAGFGYFVHYANSLGHCAVGTEVTKEYAAMSSDALNGRIVYVEGDRYTEHFAPASFDLVYMEHVFEHVMHPVQLLAQVKQLLRPGGIFFVAVPNMRSFSSRLQGKFWSWALPPDHLYFYSAENLPLLLKRSGFEVEEVLTKDYFHRSIPQLYSFRRMLNIFRKMTGRKPKPYDYRYPQTIGDRVVLMPYYLLYPFVRWSWKRSGGNELVIFARCRP